MSQNTKDEQSSGLPDYAGLAEIYTAEANVYGGVSRIMLAGAAALATVRLFSEWIPDAPAVAITCALLGLVPAALVWMLLRLRELGRERKRLGG